MPIVSCLSLKFISAPSAVSVVNRPQCGDPPGSVPEFRGPVPDSRRWPILNQRCWEDGDIAPAVNDGQHVTVLVTRSTSR